MLPMFTVVFVTYIPGAGFQKNLAAVVRVYSGYWSLLMVNMWVAVKMLFGSDCIFGTQDYRCLFSGAIRKSKHEHGSFPIIRFFSILAFRKIMQTYDLKELPKNRKEEINANITKFLFLASQEMFWNTMSKLLITEIRHSTTAYISIVCSILVTFSARLVAVWIFRNKHVMKRFKNAATVFSDIVPASSQDGSDEMKTGNTEITKDIPLAGSVFASKKTERSMSIRPIISSRPTVSSADKPDVSMTSIPMFDDNGDNAKGNIKGSYQSSRSIKSSVRADSRIERKLSRKTSKKSQSEDVVLQIESKELKALEQIREDKKMEHSRAELGEIRLSALSMPTEAKNVIGEYESPPQIVLSPVYTTIKSGKSENNFLSIIDPKQKLLSVENIAQAFSTSAMMLAANKPAERSTYSIEDAETIKSIYTPMSDEADYGFQSVCTIYADWCCRLSAYLMTLFYTTTMPQYQWMNCESLGIIDSSYVLTTETHVIRSLISMLLAIVMDVISVKVDVAMAKVDYERGVEEFANMGISFTAFFHLTFISSSVGGLLILSQAGILDKDPCFRAGRMGM
ncbi:hypothetical protein HDU97_008904 [Phlyctochytrium planicorne]|nr:hypothetical protein HDU97_008904 [Phlyctochytrium planicorne]